MRGAAALLFLMLIVWALPSASASIDRSETYVVISSSSLEYHAELSFTGSDAQAERARADLNADGWVDATEADTYANALSEERTGNAPASFSWDGQGPVWLTTTVTPVGYEGNVGSGTPLTRTLDGRLALNSSEGTAHALTIPGNASLKTWVLTVIIPEFNWSFGDVSGLNVTNQTNTSLDGSLMTGVGRISVNSPYVPPPAGNNTTVPPGPAGNGWGTLFGGPSGAFLVAGLALVLVGGVGLLVARRLAVARALVPAGEGTNGPRHPYIIEGVLLIYKDGRLLFNKATGDQGTLAHPDLVGSMFTAVLEFIRDSFSPTEELSRLTYGPNTIVISRGTNLFGAAVIFGEPDEDLHDELKETVRRVENAFAGVIEQWDGSTEPFAAMGDIVRPLFALSAGVKKEEVRSAGAVRGVRILSETEYYNGYVRLRVAVANNTDQPIDHAVLEVRFNESVLVLARVEPATFVAKGTRVTVGKVAPWERVGVAYYLDPQTCTETNIEGSCTYRTAQGLTQTAAMRSRRAEIICPLFFTREHANPAMLKRLIETSVKVRDSKAFRVEHIPPGVTYKNLYEMAMEVVMRHDVQLVRDFSNGTPFYGRAWFYGRTKVKQHTVIIRAGAYEERRALEFYVAADSASAITGLLAELNRAFIAGIQRRFPGVRVGLVLDEEAKQALARAGMSLDDHAPGAPATA